MTWRSHRQAWKDARSKRPHASPAGAARCGHGCAGRGGPPSRGGASMWRYLQLARRTRGRPRRLAPATCGNAVRAWQPVPNPVARCGGHDGVTVALGAEGAPGSAAARVAIPAADANEHTASIRRRGLAANAAQAPSGARNAVAAPNLQPLQRRNGHLSRRSWRRSARHRRRPCGDPSGRMESAGRDTLLASVASVTQSGHCRGGSEGAPGTVVAHVAILAAGVEERRA